MGTQITLPIWPANTDCLKWSQDNLIACAGGDSVAILVPGPTEIAWRSTLIQTNGFTKDEVPLVEPLSFGSYSIGEELSTRQVQALEWSPPGLGSHGRCVLAVLSSNHTLSIWACAGKPEDNRDWKRVLVVNHALRECFSKASKPDPENQQDINERTQVSQRVRAFAWSPPYDKWALSDEPTLSTACGEQFLSVSTEASAIFLLRVVSPYNIWKPETDWSVEIVKFVDSTVIIGSVANAEAGRPHDETADHIAWGPWHIDLQSNHCSTLSRISKGRLFCSKILCQPSADGEKSSLSTTGCQRLFPNHSNLTGPLESAQNTPLMVLFGPDAIFCAVADENSDSGWVCTTHHLDGRWDEVSGVAFTRSASSTTHAHVTSILSSSSAPTSTLTVPLRSEENSIKPTWQKAIADLKKVYSIQHNLEGNVMEKVWGVAASPSGDFVATATILFPSKAVAYVRPADYRCEVTISRQADSEDAFLRSIGMASSSFEFSSQSLLFALRDYVDHHDGPVNLEELVDAMSKDSNSVDHEQSQDIESGGQYLPKWLQYAAGLRRGIFRSPELKNIRLRILAGIATGDTAFDESLTRPIVECLVKEILDFSSQLEDVGELGSKILNVYKPLQAKLHPSLHPPQHSPEWREDCAVCGEALPFHSINWARCKNGHQFTRCALTFLAVQEPGITKTCGICQTVYLNEWALSSLDPGKKQGDVEMTEGARWTRGAKRGLFG